MKKELRIGNAVPTIMIGLSLLMILGGLLYVSKDNILSKRHLAGVSEAAVSVSDATLPENVRVYALGEATHGNAEFQQLKLEIFRRLVEENGYKAFGMEECFGTCLEADLYAQGKLEGVTSEDLVKKMGCTIYQTKDVAAVIDYVKDYNENVPDGEKLHFFGFDMQGLTDYDLEFLDRKVNALAASDELLSYLEHVKALMDYNFTVTAENKPVLRAEFEELKAFIRANNPDEDYELCMAEHIMDVAAGLLTYYDGNVELADRLNFRDRSMAENVRWFDEYLEKKGQRGILVAAHNGHVACQHAEQDGMEFDSFGSVLKKIYGDEVYVIGTDYYYSTDNVNDHSYYSYEYVRRDHDFCSADVVAWQAKNYADGRFFLDFDEVGTDTELYQIISTPNLVGEMGEGYIPDNDYCRDNMRAEIIMNQCFDGMVFYYKVNPIRIID